MLEAKNIVKTFGENNTKQEVLKGIDFKLDNTDFVTVMGPSGGGKTTFLNCLSLLLKPTSGEIYFDDKKVNFNNVDEIDHIRRNNIGLVFQNSNLISCLTPLENILIAMQDKSRYSGKKEKAMRYLKMLGLEDKYNVNTNVLSGGEKQRVSIARAIINEPSILMCDEPTGALDKKNSENVLNILVDLHKNNKCGILLVTHDESIGKLGKTKIRLVEGKINEIR